MIRMLTQCNRLSSEVVVPPSLELLKIRLDGALCNLG